METLARRGRVVHHCRAQINLEALPDDPAILQGMLRSLVGEQGVLHAENDKLRLLIQRMLRQQFGRRSEQLDPEQLQLGLEDLEQAVAAGEAAQDTAAGSDEQRRQRRDARPRRNQGVLPAHLPRDEVLIDIEDKICPCCNGALHLIGEDRAEQLDIVPAQLQVRMTRRPRYGCRVCEAPSCRRLRRTACWTAAWPQKPWWRTSLSASSATTCRSTARPGCQPQTLRVSAGATGRHPGPLDAGDLGRPRLLVADAAV